MGIHAMYDSWRNRPEPNEYQKAPQVRYWVDFVDEEGKADRYEYPRRDHALLTAKQLRADGMTNVVVRRGTDYKTALIQEL
jgi:hypothetical protein